MDNLKSTSFEQGSQIARDTATNTAHAIEEVHQLPQVSSTMIGNDIVNNIQTEFDETNYIALQQTTVVSLKQQLHNLLINSLNQYRFNNDTLMPEIERRLSAWKIRQQLADNCIDTTDIGELDIIQSRCESIVENIAEIITNIESATKLLSTLHAYLDQTESAIISHRLRSLSSEVKTALSLLIKATFINVHQPPRVVKTKTKFSATILSLVGSKLCELKILSPEVPSVNVLMIRETEALSYISNGTFPNNVVKELSGNEGQMEKNEQSNQFGFTFTDLYLQKIKRVEKNNSGSVLHEKFSLLFYSNFKLVNGINIPVSTISSPISVVVHGSQEPQAWATIMWGKANTIGEPNVNPYAMPENITWSKIICALNIKFASETGRPLPEYAKQYLAEKIFGSCTGGNYNSMQLSWSKFCKESLPGKNFSFWEWLYAIMKFIKEHLKTFWEKNYIYGFVSKQLAENMLLSSRNDGTFLLRFSDSVLGGISLVWVETDETGLKKIKNVEPYNSTSFAKGNPSLRDRLMKNQKICYLYQHSSKHEVFGPYCLPEATTPNGYIRVLMIEVFHTVPYSTATESDSRSQFSPSLPRNTVSSTENYSSLQRNSETENDHSSNITVDWTDIAVDWRDNLFATMSLDNDNISSILGDGM